MKYLFLAFILLAIPTPSLSQDMINNNTLKEITSKIDHETGQAGRNFEQAFEDFKNDPIGEIKEYFYKLKEFFVYLLHTMGDAWEELKRKVG